MAVSAKSKSRVILVEEPVADSRMNDNNPGMHPGHELSDLRNAPRQPAAEVSIHYARLALIGSFPQDPQTASNTVAAAPSMDASLEKDESARPRQRNVVMACLGSLRLPCGCSSRSWSSGSWSRHTTRSKRPARW